MSCVSVCALQYRIDGTDGSARLCGDATLQIVRSLHTVNYVRTRFTLTANLTGIESCGLRFACAVIHVSERFDSNPQEIVSCVDYIVCESH